MQTILLIRFLIKRRLKYLIRFCYVKILIVKVNNKVKAIVNYKVIQLFRSIVVVYIVYKENLIL